MYVSSVKTVEEGNHDGFRSLVNYKHAYFLKVGLNFKAK